MAQTLTKKQVCSLLNVSRTTLKDWLNRRYFSDLEKIGYRTNQKVLTPLQVNFLVDKIGLDLKGEE